MGQYIISWSPTLKYLGVVFKSARMVITDVDETVRKFYASANAILSHVKYASEMSKLFLVKTFCLPVLSYSCESLNFSRKPVADLGTGTTGARSPFGRVIRNFLILIMQRRCVNIVRKMRRVLNVDYSVSLLRTFDECVVLFITDNR